MKVNGQTCIFIHQHLFPEQFDFSMTRVLIGKVQIQTEKEILVSLLSHDVDGLVTLEGGLENMMKGSF